MSLNQFSDLTFAEFRKLYLWSEPQVSDGSGRRVPGPPAAGPCAPLRPREGGHPVAVLPDVQLCLVLTAPGESAVKPHPHSFWLAAATSLAPAELPPLLPALSFPHIFMGRLMPDPSCGDARSSGVWAGLVVLIQGWPRAPQVAWPACCLRTTVPWHVAAALPPRLQNCSATKGNFLRSSGPYPDFIDWRKRGNYVTPVKNQVRSTCCW